MKALIEQRWPSLKQKLILPTDYLWAQIGAFLSLWPAGLSDQILDSPSHHNVMSTYFIHLEFIIMYGGIIQFHWLSKSIFSCVNMIYSNNYHYCDFKGHLYSIQNISIYMINFYIFCSLFTVIFLQQYIFATITH